MTAIDTAIPAEIPSKRGVKRLIVPALVVLAAIAAVGFGARWLTVGRFMETTNDAYLKADAMIVAPRVSGYVSDVLVAANQDVEPRQLLGRGDDGPYRAQFARAKADVDAAEADIRRLQAEIAHQQSVTEQAQAA